MATILRCNNSEPGWYNQECGKPAMWTGRTDAGSRFAACLQCRAEGWEARHWTDWRPVDVLPTELA